MSESVKLLSFESSCDDTSVALLEAVGNDSPKLRGLSVQSQDEVHSKWGGIVPELASRAHLQNLLPCLKKVLAESNTSLEEVDVFAATARPGLVGSLLVGHTAAKALSFIFSKPFVSVNHLEGHIYSIFLERDMSFPYLSLVVSGGHTCLYQVDDFGSYQSLGLSLDDAAGEALDKAAKLLGLGFPGGADLEKLALESAGPAYSFGRVQVPGFHFSFSGLKSEFYRLTKKEGSDIRRADAASAYQAAVMRHIHLQVRKAIEETGIRRLCIVGGVARNQLLRDQMQELKAQGVLEDFCAPSPLYCTDNAAMIGLVALKKFISGLQDNLEDDVGASTRPSRQRIRREKQQA